METRVLQYHLITSKGVKIITTLLAVIDWLIGEHTCCERGGVSVGDLEWDEAVVDKDNIPRDTHLDDVLVVDVDDVLVTDLLVLVVDGELENVTYLQLNLGSTTLCGYWKSFLYDGSVLRCIHVREQEQLEYTTRVRRLLHTIRCSV